LKAPYYRITRSTRWKEDIDPWKEPERLPIYCGGLLGELVYSNDPVIIDDLPGRLKKDDPAYEELKGFEMLVSTPQFEDGESINMNAILVRDKTDFPLDKLPFLVWMSNLWGRGVLNLVLRKELQKSHEKLEAANAELDRELDVVGEIQRSLLPKSLPRIPGLQLAANYRTSERAGGDYYDIFDCEAGRWGILIADVSGHGAPAAVIMAITHTIAHLHPGNGTPPGELLTFINAKLAGKYTNRNGSFVTAFYGIYDSTQRKLTYARAGHNSPRLLRGGEISSLDGQGGVPLGVLADCVYEERTQTLERGDVIALYTDGIVEARSRDSEMFGEERLDEALKAAGSNAEASVARVLAELELFTGGAPPLDDQTVLVAAVT
jgi:sigma-B regulation protein RsbU (phosphoserine phosphatase)